jgi:hypothetical protein
MKKRFAVLMVCCGFMMLQVPYAAGTAQAAQAAQTAQTVPPYVEVPNAGEYKMGGDNPAVNQDGKMQTGTDFYLRIENPRRGGSSGGSSDGSSGSDGNGGSSTSSVGAQSITYANFPMGNDELEELGDLADQDGNLPKTGDYGLDKIVLCELALLFGTGYLICDQYEKKHEKNWHEKERKSVL